MVGVLRPAVRVLCLDQPEPLSRAGLAEYERGWLRGHAWVDWSKIASLPDTVEPPHLVGILAALDPSGPWPLGHGPCSPPG